MSSTLQKILKALRSRVARNIYLWALMLYLVLNMNINNERELHYGIIQSPWYAPFIIIGTLLQAILLYTNNLVLAPRFLSRKKYGLYFLLAGLLVTVISVAYTIGVKLAGYYFDVNHVQQIGFVSAPVTKGWSVGDILDDTATYLAGNIMWVLIFTMAWYMNDYYKQQQLAEEARKKQTETELNFLKSQINPHFLFNTLNNLYGLALKKADNAPDAILKLSSILRYLLYESNIDKVSYEKEKEVIYAYIELELLRLSDDNKLRFLVTADRDYSIPPLLWLPVLENLFKHGTRYISDNIEGSFNFAIANNELTIICTNKYKGASKVATADKVGGIGLTNLRKRLELLYPCKHHINETKTEDTYTISINISLA